jgi:hypothetical protein
MAVVRRPMREKEEVDSEPGSPTRPKRRPIRTGSSNMRGIDRLVLGCVVELVSVMTHLRSEFRTDHSASTWESNPNRIYSPWLMAFGLSTREPMQIHRHVLTTRYPQLDATTRTRTPSYLCVLRGIYRACFARIQPIADSTACFGFFRFSFVSSRAPFNPGPRFEPILNHARSSYSAGPATGFLQVSLSKVPRHSLFRVSPTAPRRGTPRSTLTTSVDLGMHNRMPVTISPAHRSNVLILIAGVLRDGAARSRPNESWRAAQRRTFELVCGPAILPCKPRVGTIHSVATKTLRTT